MPADNIVCEICCGNVRVLQAQHEYEVVPLTDGGQHTLRESRYEMDCPQCGQRVQIEPHPWVDE